MTATAATRSAAAPETDPTTGATRTTSYTYDDLGLLESVDGPRTDVGDLTRFAYDAQGDLVSVTDALGHRTQITAHDNHGRPLAVRDPNGTLTALTYDAPGGSSPARSMGRPPPSATMRRVIASAPRCRTARPCATPTTPRIV